MFNKICIKSKELNKQKIDIAFLVETMLFYEKVIVLAHQKELITLLEYFGELFLEELIKSGRIDLRIRENVLASMIFPNDRYNINLFSFKDETASETLYQAHKSIIEDSAKNSAFADKFLQLSTPFRYGNELTAQIRNDFENRKLLTQLLPIYLNSRVPNFELPEKIEIEIINDKPFIPFEAYSLNSNIDLKKLNELHKNNNPNDFYPIDFSGFFLSLAESKGDIFIASAFESELVTNDLYSKFIEIQLSEIIKRRVQSQDNLKLFDEYVLKDCHSIGEAFIKGIVSPKELLQLLEKADKFRSWLSKVPDDKNLIGEYYKESTKETFADKLPTKATRYIIFEAVGITLDVMGAGGIGTAMGTVLSAFDTFYLDKLLTGWKPNQFIDNTLIPKVIK